MEDKYPIPNRCIVGEDTACFELSGNLISSPEAVWLSTVAPSKLVEKMPSWLMFLHQRAGAALLPAAHWVYCARNALASAISARSPSAFAANAINAS